MAVHLSKCFITPQKIIVKVLQLCALCRTQYYSPAGKLENCSLFDKSTKIGMHVTLMIL